MLALAGCAFPCAPAGDLAKTKIFRLSPQISFFCISSRLQASLRLSYNAKKIVRSPYDFAFAVRGGLCSPWRAVHSPTSSPEGPLQKTVFVLSHSGFFVPISFAQASLAQIWVQKNRMICIIRFSAVRGGFEPPEPLRVRQFSKLLVSATHPPHREWSAKIGGIR